MAYPRDTPPTVLIVGAGIAGMTAALYLLEAGFNVRVIEQSDHVGGKFGATDGADGAVHEHAYHFLGDWCLNFWALASKINLSRKTDFVASNGVGFLRPRENTRLPLASRLSMLRLESVRARFIDNVFGGVIPPDDMVVWAYSLLEIMTEGFDLDEKEFLNRISVNGFMRNLPYMTDLAALLHQEALLKAFSIPSYETSARSYRRFARLFSRDQDGWILAQPVSARFWPCFMRALKRLGRERGFDTGAPSWPVEFQTSLEELHATKRNLVSAIAIRKPNGRRQLLRSRHDFTDLLLTLPPERLVSVVERSASLRTRVPGLLELRNLKSKQMASLDLYLRPALAGVPAQHVTLIDDRPFRERGPGRGRTASTDDDRRTLLARYGNRMASRFALSFVDNYQVWNGKPRKREETWLNVVSADFEELAGLANQDKDAAYRLILRELREYLDFDDRQIDARRTSLQLNTDLPLFMNTVNSWQYRPIPGPYRDVHTALEFTNLFLAGDYCRSSVDIVSLEGAVLTARISARQIAARHGRADRVPPEDVPPELSDQALGQLKRDLAAWVELASRGAFGAGRHLRKIGLP